MAKTIFATSNALTKEVFEEELFQDILQDTIAADLMGEDKGNFIQVKTELTKSQGDLITFGLRSNLTGAGVTSGQVLEGNEEALSTYDYGITLEQYRHAVRDNGALDRQRAMFSIDSESKTAIKDWYVQKIDELQIAALLASPTKTLYRDGTAGAFSGTATQSTAKSAIRAANSKLTPNFLSALRVWAATGGNGATFRLKPVKVDGRDMYGLLTNPAVLYDLETDASYQQAMREAMERGKTNPLFRKARAVWKDVIIYESERVPLFTDGGAGAEVGCHSVLMGAQAGVWAWGKRGSLVQDTFDYGNQHGFAYEMIAKAGKPKFNSKDYGAIGVTLAATNVTTV